MENTQVKAFVFSTDGVYAQVNGYRTLVNEEEFQMKSVEFSVYDDGASHYLLKYNVENYEEILGEHPELTMDLIKLIHKNK
jgi:hypothetical protein